MLIMVPSGINATIYLFFIHFIKTIHYWSKSPHFAGGNRFSKICCLRGWVISISLGGDNKNLEESLPWGWHEWKCLLSIFWLENAFYSNLNPLKFRIFPDHGRIYSCFHKKLIKIFGQRWSPRWAIEIWGGVSMMLILID